MNFKFLESNKVRGEENQEDKESKIEPIDETCFEEEFEGVVCKP